MRVDRRKRCCGREKTRYRINRYFVANTFQVCARHNGGSAALDHVRQKRCIEAFANAAHLAFALRRLYEENISAGLQESLSAPQRLVEAMRGSRICASDDLEVLRGARLGGHLDLARRIIERDDSAAWSMAAFLWELLVF